jgi:hypothetical protein
MTMKTLVAATAIALMSTSAMAQYYATPIPGQGTLFTNPGAMTGSSYGGNPTGGQQFFAPGVMVQPMPQYTPRLPCDWQHGGNACALRP